MLFYNLRNVIDLLHHTKRKKVEKILDELKTDGDHGDENFTYFNAVFKSPKTGRYYNRLYVKILSPETGKVLYETIYKCPKTGKIMPLVMEGDEILNSPCPECKGKLSIGEGLICWD